MTYQCKNQIRDARFQFLMCKALRNNSEPIRTIKEATECYCIHQSHCKCSNQSENTDSAKSCKYLNQNP